MEKLTLTVGISAFNEESNLGFLLKEVIAQKISRVTLEKVLVISDGSADDTAKIARQNKDRRVKVIEGNKRRGKTSRQNEIIAQTTSDLLVILDADISIKNKRFLETLVRPVLSNKADLTSSLIRPLVPKTVVEKTLFISNKIKETLFSEFKDGSNLYTCYGPARAFSRKFYKNLHIPETDGDDMFSYLSCTKAGFYFAKVSKAITYFRLPSNLKDHFKQSLRYHRSKKDMLKYFDKEFVNNEFNIPPRVYLKTMWKARAVFLAHFILIFFYLAILSYLKLLFLFKDFSTANWDVRSTKFVRSHL